MEAKQDGESVMNPFVSLHTVDAVFDGIAVHEPRVRVIYCQDPAVFRYLITGEFFRVILTANIGEVWQYTSSNELASSQQNVSDELSDLLIQCFL